MNVKELSSLFNVSESTVKRIIRDVYPDKMQNGKRTILTKTESIILGEYIRKTGYIQPVQNEQVAIQNEQAYLTKDDLKDFGKSLVQEMFKQIIPLIQNNQPKQIENKPKLTITEYIKKNNITSYNYQALSIQAGKQATRLSKELHKDISFKREGNYDVNMYDEDILETAIIVAKKIIEKNNLLF